MQGFITLCFALFFWAFLGCSGENFYQSGTDKEQAVTEPFQNNLSNKQPPKGKCPNIFFESSMELSNGAMVTWTSSFGGFDYKKGTDYTVTVTWTISSGSATFVSFEQKKMVWTPPKDVEGRGKATAPTNSGLELTVNMSDMHRVDEPDWRGYIGNGHFKLELEVNGIRVKLGVNVHLEDPDAGFAPRCPEG